jgi:hypothetical protein
MDEMIVSLLKFVKKIGRYNLKIGVDIKRSDNLNFIHLCGKLTMSRCPRELGSTSCFYTNKSYLGRCLRDYTVSIAEKSFLEAATGLLRPCTLKNPSCRG